VPEAKRYMAERGVTVRLWSPVSGFSWRIWWLLVEIPPLRSGWQRGTAGITELGGRDDSVGWSEWRCCAAGMAMRRG